MIRKVAGSWLVTCALVACSGHAPSPVQLAVVPPAADAGGDAQLVAEGLGALLLAQLRAMPGASVRIDARGCAAGANTSHVLQIAREYTEQSALILLHLHGCQDGSDRRETLVQPRAARRDWSGEAAYWVASQLQVPIALTSTGGSVSEADMDRFLAAIAHLNRRTRADIAAARDGLQVVVGQHPDFALGHAQFAAAQLLAYEYGLADRASAQQAARASIDAALRLDPDLGLAHAVQGLSLMMDGRYRAAALVLARAAALDPGDAAIHLWLGNALLYSGRPAEAISWLDDAVRIEPDLSAARTSRAEAACYGGDEPRCESFLEQAPSASMDDFIHALLRAHRGAFAAARADLERSRQVNETWTLELKADVCVALQDPACVAQTLDELRQRFPDEPETRRLQARSSVSSEAPAAANDTSGFTEIDLWQIGLGLDPLMHAARTSGTEQARLQSVLDALHRGGLVIPVVQMATACLRAYRGDTRAVGQTRATLTAQGYQHPELWRRWGCDGGA